MKLVNGCPLPHGDVILPDNNALWYSVDGVDYENGFPPFLHRFVVGLVENVNCFVLQHFEYCAVDSCYTVDVDNTVILHEGHFNELRGFYREVCRLRSRTPLFDLANLEIELCHTTSLEPELIFTWQNTTNDFHIHASIDDCCFNSLEIPFDTMRLVILEGGDGEDGYVSE